MQKGVGADEQQRKEAHGQRPRHVEDAGARQAARRLDDRCRGLRRRRVLLCHGHPRSRREDGAVRVRRGAGDLVACGRGGDSCRDGGHPRRTALRRAALQPLHRVQAARPRARPCVQRPAAPDPRQARGRRPRRPRLDRDGRRRAARGLLRPHYQPHLHRRAHGVRHGGVSGYRRGGAAGGARARLVRRGGRARPGARLALVGGGRPAQPRPRRLALELRPRGAARLGRGPAVRRRRPSPGRARRAQR